MAQVPPLPDNGGASLALQTAPKKPAELVRCGGAAHVGREDRDGSLRLPEVLAQRCPNGAGHFQVRVQGQHALDHASTAPR